MKSVVLLIAMLVQGIFGTNNAVASDDVSALPFRCIVRPPHDWYKNLDKLNFLNSGDYLEGVVQSRQGEKASLELKMQFAGKIGVDGDGKPRWIGLRTERTMQGRMTLKSNLHGLSDTYEFGDKQFPELSGYAMSELLLTSFNELNISETFQIEPIGVEVTVAEPTFIPAQDEGSIFQWIGQLSFQIVDFKTKTYANAFAYIICKGVTE